MTRGNDSTKKYLGVCRIWMTGEDYMHRRHIGSSHCKKADGVKQEATRNPPASVHAHASFRSKPPILMLYALSLVLFGIHSLFRLSPVFWERRTMLLHAMKRTEEPVSRNENQFEAPANVVTENMALTRDNFSDTRWSTDNKTMNKLKGRTEETVHIRGEARSRGSSKAQKPHKTNNDGSSYSSENSLTRSGAEPLPLQLWRRYVREHSKDVQGPENKFAVVPYFCPERAGNILHNLMNNVLWAILHNRTILYEYRAETPQKQANSESLCESFLPRNKNFISFAEAKSRWNLSTPVAVNVEDSQRFEENSKYWVVYFPQLPDMAIEDASFSAWSDNPAANKYRSYISSNLAAAYEELYDLGEAFAHGMVLRNIFTWPRSRMVDSSSKEDEISIALHSRHIVDGDDGRWVNHEKDCLERLLRTIPHKHCIVYIMSDRPLTVSLLSIWLRNHGCETAIVEHDMDQKTTNVLEHGPHSGVGFLKDVQFASQARTALIGNRFRSSYMLLEELATYDKMMTQFSSARTVNDLRKHGGLQFCALPRTAPTGYNYGPGTPTFVRPMYLKPLKPDTILDRYVKRHDGFYWQDKPHVSRRFAIIDYDCDVENVGQWSHVVSNALLFSIITNRTLLLRQRRGQTCRKLALHKKWVQDIISNNGEIINRFLVNKTEAPMISLVNASAYNTHATVVLPRVSRQLKGGSKEISFLGNGGVVGELFSLGTDYLYGILWNFLFLFNRPVRQGIPSVSDSATAVYAREWSEFESTRECLSRFLGNLSKCEVVPVSFDESTLHKLTTWLRDHFPDCRVLTVDASPKTECLQQAYLARMARRLIAANAWSGDKELVWLREQLDYKRLHDIWMSGQSPPKLSPLQFCAGARTQSQVSYRFG